MIYADSLFGTMTPHQIGLIKDCWEHIEYLEKSITRLEDEIHAHLEPYRTEYELLQTIPEVSERMAAALIAEMGSTWSNSRQPTTCHLGQE